MFDHLRQKNGTAVGRLTGGSISLVVHGALFAGVIWLGTRHAAPVAPPGPTIVFNAASLGHATRAPTTAPPHPANPPKPPQTHRVVIPRVVKPLPPPTVDVPPQAPPTIDEPPVEGPPSAADGPPGTGGGTDGTPADGQPTSLGGPPQVVDFAGPGVTMPVVIPDESQPFRWTRAQLDQRVEGQAIAQCSLTPDGVLIGCKLLKRIPQVDDAQIQEYLAGLRYKPATQGGRPIGIRHFTVPIRLRIP